MRVATILTDKGSTVATVSGRSTLAEAAEQLRLRGVGALVVSEDGRGIEGILSERDLVRRIAERGESALSEEVASVMSPQVRTCTPSDTCEDLARMMTDHRVRHIPVTSDGALAGIVSIGDIVKARLDELETETEALHNYIATGR